jgi:hypothetical protein
MTLRFVDPRGVPARPADPYSLSTDLSAEGTTVGLLANGFPDSVTFLDELERVLNEQLPAVRTLRYAKPNASDIATDQLLEGITRECRAVVTAYGH